MKAATNDLTSVTMASAPKTLEAFFASNTPESVKEIFWYLFKAWVSQPSDKKKQYSDEEIALFLDQLINLVAAASTLHQENRVSRDYAKEGTNHV